MNRFCVVLIRGLMRFFGSLPLRFHYMLVGTVAWILEKVIGYRKSVIYVNLARSFPEKKYWELDRIAHDFYIHMAEIILETIWFGGSSLKRLRESHIVEMANVKVLDDAFESSPSVTLLYSHCGNWELLGGLPIYNYDDCVNNPCTLEQTYVVYRRLSNHVWNEVFLKNRIAPIPDYKGEIESEQVLRLCIKNRKKKAVYFFIADQSPYFTKFDLGMFLNQHTKAMVGSVAVAHKLGHSVVYMNMARCGRGHYEMQFTKICDDASKVDPEVLLRQYFDLLEKDIRTDPANWLWSHKRWK